MERKRGKRNTAQLCQHETPERCPRDLLPPEPDGGRDGLNVDGRRRLVHRNQAVLAPPAESQSWRWGISHDGTPGPGRSAPASPRQPAQDDAALQQQRPGNAQQLPLADAEVAPALFDHVRQAGPPQAGAPASSDTQRERLRSLAVADWATPGGGGTARVFCLER